MTDDAVTDVTLDDPAEPPEPADDTDNDSDEETPLAVSDEPAEDEGAP